MNTTTTKGTNETAPVEFLTRRELARRWKCSTETVKRRQASGMLRPVRLGARKLLYRLAEIEAIENNTNAGQGASGAAAATGSIHAGGAR